MFGKLGVPELLLILVIVLVFFGGRRIPEIAKGLGEGIKNFRNAMKDENAPPAAKPDAEKK
ncbi:MAG: twin-arginine translocase TatA/TatE family subunit [Acidobacteria bacterium]|nr:twin-arginine translocase TatA/TatE family subunit [Acidobacteriota bacterium]